MEGKCKLCQQTVVCQVIGDQSNQALGETMLKHMGVYHMDFMQKVVKFTRAFSGFIVMNRFNFVDERMEDDKEEMRDTLCDLIMEDAPEDDGDDLASEIGGQLGEEGEYIIEPSEAEEEGEVELDNAKGERTVRRRKQLGTATVAPPASDPPPTG